MFKLTIHLRHGEEHVIEVFADRRQRLVSDVLRNAGQPLNTRCGQRGLCNGCLFELRSGSLARANTGATILPSDAADLLRGCETRLPDSGEAVIVVPPRSLLSHAPQIVTSFRLNVPRAHDPLWQGFRIPHDDLAPSAALPDALCESVRSRTEREFPVVASRELNDIQPSGDGSFDVGLAHQGDAWVLDAIRFKQPVFGAAVDIGTTTVVAAIVELETGRIAATSSALNAQVKLGDNVLTRINLCMQDPEMVGRLQTAVVRDTLIPLLTEAAREAGIELDHLACVVVAGNTTMLHLLDGVDPSPLGVAPFAPTFLGHRVLETGTWPWPVGVSGNGGAADGAAVAESSDVPRGATRGYHGRRLASGMAYRDDTCLLVDIGTNGEIVLRHRGDLLGCATAAGPAFEGTGLKCGMRAGTGAIGHIRLDPDTLRADVEVIGGGKPIGICGTAYLDFLARARELGLIGRTGRFTVKEIPGIVQRDLYGRAFVVAQGHGKEPLVITEADVAYLLQAKAAIAAGVVCLLTQAGTTSRDIDTVFLAGGFGFHMHVDSLLGCGLLPGFLPEQIQMVGNSALAGAYLALLDHGSLSEIRRIGQRIRTIELNLDPRFETTYIDQLSLP